MFQTQPYTMLKLEAELLKGNDRFEGYAVELIFELSLLLQFNYTFIVEEDNEYGECRNEITNEWDGMIGKVMKGVSAKFIYTNFIYSFFLFYEFNIN